MNIRTTLLALPWVWIAIGIVIALVPGIEIGMYAVFSFIILPVLTIISFIVAIASKIKKAIIINALLLAAEALLVAFMLFGNFKFS